MSEGQYSGKASLQLLFTVFNIYILSYFMFRILGFRIVKGGQTSRTRRSGGKE